MSKWGDAERLIRNKMCGPARNGKSCGHPKCEEAQSVLVELNAGVFSDRARTILTNRLCKPARDGDDCGHDACAEIKANLAAS
ncbi:MAG TPA: hypothetical protein VD969_09450 [Symbiobacteriaceae bacterium]|nr:hypothetical protein [Symbiobacteriaceae bacterium]